MARGVRDECEDAEQREHADGQRRILASITDITDTTRRRAELEARAMTDPLTGCLNRTSVLHELETALVHRETVAVVFTRSTSIS